jgi:hypothetical protein
MVENRAVAHRKVRHAVNRRRRRRGCGIVPPWHQDAAIRQVLAFNLRLELMVFPVAAPQLNPLKHVWKETHRAVSHNHAQPRLPDLAAQFEQHFSTTTSESSFLSRYGYTGLCPMYA